MERERVVVIFGVADIPKVGLAVDPLTRRVFRDGRLIGRAVGFAPHKTAPADGWLSVDLETED